MLTTVLPSKANSEPSLPWLTPPEPLSSMRSGTGIRRPETKTASSFPHPLLTRIETRKKEENSPSSPAAAKIPGSSSSHQALLAAIRVDHQTRSRCVPEVGTTSLLLTSPRRQNQLSGGCGSASSRVSRCVPTYVLGGYFWSPPGNATFPIQAPPPKNPHQRGKGEKKNTPMQQPCVPASLTLPRRLARRGASDVPPPPKKRTCSSGVDFVFISDEYAVTISSVPFGGLLSDTLGYKCKHDLLARHFEGSLSSKHTATIKQSQSKMFGIVVGAINSPGSPTTNCHLPTQQIIPSLCFGPTMAVIHSPLPSLPSRHPRVSKFDPLECNPPSQPFPSVRPSVQSSLSSRVD